MGCFIAGRRYDSVARGYQYICFLCSDTWVAKEPYRVLRWKKEKFI
jgi:hypothetical protein